jgi:hypothetical protein
VSDADTRTADAEQATIERAARAKEALTNPVLREAFALLKDTYIAGVRGCDPKDDLGRYRYTVALNAVDGVERHLKSAVDTGALTAAQASELAAPPRRWVPRF